MESAPEGGEIVSRYLTVRVLSIIPTIIGVEILVFLLIRFIPGTVVEQILGAQFNVSQGQIDALRNYFGLDQPMHTQFIHWSGGVVRGDLGDSWRTGQPVTSLIWSRLPVTATLAGLSILVASLIAIPVGVLAAVRRGGLLDAALRVVSLLGLSIPEFWLGTLLVLLASRYLDWTPAARYVPLGEDPIEHVKVMILPTLTLAAVLSANITRMTRSAMLDVLSHDYIRTARAKGLNERRVLVVHAFRGALIPIVTIVGLQTGYLLGGVVVVEQVFTLPGLGRLVVGAIQQRDYPLVQGVILISALLFILVNLIVDVLYGVLDPRVRAT
jgi:peptide/nickel transport system permease protein